MEIISFSNIHGSEGMTAYEDMRASIIHSTALEHSSKEFVQKVLAVETK
jgi:hypothetical protein